jgi:hypothetical protein
MPLSIMKDKPVKVVVCNTGCSYGGTRYEVSVLVNGVQQGSTQYLDDNCGSSYPECGSYSPGEEWETSGSCGPDRDCCWDGGPVPNEWADCCDSLEFDLTMATAGNFTITIHVRIDSMESDPYEGGAVCPVDHAAFIVYTPGDDNGKMGVWGATKVPLHAESGNTCANIVLGSYCATVSSQGLLIKHGTLNGPKLIQDIDNYCYASMGYVSNWSCYCSEPPPEEGEPACYNTMMNIDSEYDLDFEVTVADPDTPCA